MKIEEQFETVTQIVLGKALSPLKDYAEYLISNAPEGRIIEKKSVASGKTVYVASAKFFLALGNRVVRADEALALGAAGKITEKEAEALTLSNAPKLLRGISTTTPEIIYSENIDTLESCGYGPTQHCFRVGLVWFSKYVAYSYWIRTSENIFGGSLLTDCSFCIRCYSSTKLVRCFEVNDSNNCADCYFCHNCEDLRDCMFCFNTKAKRYSIGNVEVGREEYLKIKKLLQGQMHSELERTKKLKYDIYNIGSRARSV